MIFVGKNLLDMIQKWTNAEGRCIHKGDWEYRYYVEIKKFIGLINLIYIYKTKNENVFVIMEQKWPCSFLQNYEPSNFSIVLHYDNANARRTRSNSKI